jgi:O-Antigen ligase
MYRFMFASAFTGPAAERVRFWIVLALLLVVALGGGASRGDVMSLLYVRPAAVLAVAALLLVPGRWDLGGIRTPILLLGGLALIMLIQLVPLPPNLWAALPQSRYAAGPELAGIAPGWRPISATPDLTVNSLLSLLPPAAMLVGYAALRNDQRWALLVVVFVIIALSMLFGVAQVTGGALSKAYLYEVTSHETPPGLFANRNHQALLLVCGFLLLRAWSVMPHPAERRPGMRSLVALLAGAVLVAMLLVTGSRAGIVLGVIGLAMTPFIRGVRQRRRGGGARRKWVVPAIAAAALLLVAAAILFGRSLAVSRLLRMDVADDVRFHALPTVLRITGDFLPFGSGFGSFDPVFRSYEPDELLSTAYLNHAHNDLAELALTGGVPAMILLLAFVAWLGTRAFALFRTRGLGARRTLGQAGLGMILLMLMASLFDYPLRTPLMATLFALACCWVGSAASRRGEGAAAPQGADALEGSDNERYATEDPWGGAENRSA